MIGARRGLATYVRAVEQLWSRRAERAVVLSPREWTLVQGWYERGIPLEIIEEAIDHRAEGRAARRPPRNLSYLAPAVQEAWNVVVSGRVDHPESNSETVHPEEAPAADDPLVCWQRARDSEETLPALRELLAELLAAARRGEDPMEVDRRLDEKLPAVAPRELLRSLRERTAARVESYRTRMAPEIVEATIGRAVLAQLRREFGLPRLSS